MTVSEIVSRGVSLLSSREDARLASDVLLAFFLGCSKESLLARSQESVSVDIEQSFLSAIADVSRGKPVAYITHEKEFYGLSLYVDERVLIPRPETELLVESVLETCGRVSASVIADIGTGSGCISLALAHHLPQARFLAVDISPDALEVTQKNVQRYENVKDRIEIVNSDLLTQIIDRKIDIVVANLPYIGEEKFRFVDKNVEEYEPKLALFAGFDGLQLYKKMFQQIKKMKNPPKYIFGEFGFGQSDELLLLLNSFFDQKPQIFSDLAGIPRIFRIQI